MSACRHLDPMDVQPLKDPARFRGSIYYRDARERARTLVAMSSFCREWGTRLHFIGSQADCDHARADVARLDPDAGAAVRFTPVVLETGGAPSERRRQNHALRAAMDQAIALDPAAIVWLELPFNAGSPPRTLAFAIPAHQASIETMTATGAPILFAAYQLNHLPDAAVRTRMASSDLVTSAPFAVAFCRDLLTTRMESNTWGVPQEAGSPQPAEQHSLRRMMQSENMVTLGQMSAGIAHELGNPLAIISSGLQYLQGKQADAASPDCDFTRMALESVGRMDVMLRTMRDFAAAKRSPAIDVDLNCAISEVLSFTAPECRRRGVQFAMQPDSTLPPVRMDIFGLKEIVLNLVKNALEAMRECGDTLTVRTRWCPDSESATVEIENNGPPIAEEALPNLFRPFFTTKSEGTGLGLYLAKQLAKTHGGDVRGPNLPHAVLFTLVLPASRAAAGKEWHAY